MEMNKMYNQLKIRRVMLLILDIAVIIFASGMGLLLRYDLIVQNIETSYIESIYHYSIINIVTTLIIFRIIKLYHSVWNYASVREMVNVFIACLLSVVTKYIGLNLLNYSVPRSYYFLYGGTLFFFTLGTRFAYRLIRLLMGRWRDKYNNRNDADYEPKSVMVIGAGEAANLIIKEIHLSRHIRNTVVKCIIDDSPEKLGRYIHGVRVVGNRNQIIKNVDFYQIDEIIIAMPSVSKRIISEIVDICKETKCELKILPGIYQLMNGEVSVRKLRKVEIEDLLGRDPVKVNLDSIMGYVKGQTVLVTGGGGSIGSELCRQIAEHEPKHLIILDIYENSVHEIQLELNRKCPDLKLTVLIASIRNSARMSHIFETYRPDIVYHAAAHKHVPLMEASPNEAIKNNVFGTWNLVIAADRSKVKRFVLISTDKAVNPTNIMGASKRICEMIVQTYNKRSKTEFVAVRFGNVLGSNGSVIPLFKKQIAAGGPVTVTHPDIIRYFMTIPEAVSLVLQAGAYAKGGEIFVLDMGEPVKIVDLAYNLIRLCGYKPNEDIMIEFTGLRPGEKLFEEMLMDEEGLQETENHMIHIGKPIKIDEERFLAQIKELKTICYDETSDIRAAIKEIVPNYVIQMEEINNVIPFELDSEEIEAPVYQQPRVGYAAQ